MVPTKLHTRSVIVLIAIVFLLATLLPFLLLGFYNVPLADDFVFAHKIRQEGFFQSQVSWYLGWTGRYFSTLLISANPLYLKWDLANAVIPAMVLIGLCCSLYYFTKGFVRMSNTVAVAVFVLFFTVYVSNLHTVSQAFYWMPSLHTYVTGIVLLLFYWGYFVRLYSGFRPVTTLTYFFSALLIFMMTGTSEVLIFYHNYILLGVLVYSYFRHKPMFAFTLFSSAISVAFGLFSLLAPGNFARRSFIVGTEINYVRHFTIMLDTVGRRLLPQYVFNLPFLLLILFVAFTFSGQRPGAGTANNFRLKPLLLLVFLFLGFIITFLPQLIANTSEERAFNFSYFTYLLTTIVATAYTSNYYRLGLYFLRLKINTSTIGILLLVLCGLATFLPTGNAVQGYKDLFSGEAKCYHAEETTRINFLHRQKGKSLVYVTPLNCKPKSLFFVDITSDPDNWKNDGYKRYFEIDTISVASSLP